MENKEQRKAQVVARTWCHDFKIGTKVTVIESENNPGVYIANDYKGNTDYLKFNEFVYERN